jgi:hypothetical protein
MPAQAIWPLPPRRAYRDNAGALPSRSTVNDTYAPCWQPSARRPATHTLLPTRLSSRWLEDTRGCCYPLDTPRVVWGPVISTPTGPGAATTRSRSAVPSPTSDYATSSSRCEGGVTRHLPGGQQLSIYDARAGLRQGARATHRPRGYGSGSSRDWAAKGTKLLGAVAALAESFERIPLEPHRYERAALQFKPGQSCGSLGLTGEELYSITGLEGTHPLPHEVTVQAEKTATEPSSPRPYVSTPRPRQRTSATAGSYCCPTTTPRT